MTMILILSEFNDLNRGNNKIELTNKIMVVFKWEALKMGGFLHHSM